MRSIKALRSLSLLLLAFFADILQVLRSLMRARTALIAENLFLRKQLAFYQEHQVQPRRTHRRSPIPSCAVVQLLQLQERFGHRSTRHADQMASPRVQTVLGVETQAWETATSQGSPEADRTNGASQSNLGTSPNRQRAVAEAGDSRVTTDRPGLLAG